MAAFTRWVLRHRRLLLLFIFASVALAVFSATRIRIRFAFRDFFDYPGNPDVAVLDRYHEDFEDPGGFVAVLVEADDVFRHDVLEYIQSVTRALEPEPVFSKIRSLTHIQAIYGKDDEVAMGELMVHLPAPGAETERIRHIALDSQLLRRRIVSPDSKATVVAATLRKPPSSTGLDEQRRAVETVRRVLKQFSPPGGVRVRVTGAPVLEVEASDALLRDQMVFTPAAVGLILLALFLTFRSFHGVALPLCAISVALVWTAGLFPLFGRPIDMINSTIPAALMVYGAVDPIFVLTRYLSKLEAGRSRDDAIVESISELALPCFLSSLTTALGFFAFATLKLPTIVNYGLVVGIGVSLSFVTTITVLPLLLAVLPAPKTRLSKLSISGFIDRRFAALWQFLSRRKLPVMAGALGVLALGALVGRDQHLSVYYTRILPPGESESAIRALEQKLSGVIRTVLFLEGPPGSMKRPEVLKAIAAVDAVAEKNPIVTTSLSPADLVAEFNEAFHEGDPRERRVPDSPALVGQYLSMLSPEDRATFLTADNARSHIQIFSVDQGTEKWRPLREELVRAYEGHLKPLGIAMSVTEQSPAGFDVLDQLAIEMLWGFLIAFGIVVVTVAVILRSIRIALISILPNLLPAVACFVILALLHVTLRIGTALFLSVSIGGLFNTTIQLSARVRQELADGQDDPDAILGRAMRQVGPPSLYTATILSLGFAIFTCSRFPDLRIFGLLAMTILLVGFFSDMIVTTTMLRLFLKWPARRAAAAAAVALALVFAFVPARALAQTPSAREIVERVLDVDPWGLMDAVVNGHAIIKDKRGTTSDLVFGVRARRYQPGLSKSLVRFSAPPDLAGSAFLQIQRKDADDDRFLFLPDLKKSRRISGNLRSNSFMGTDFSYADLDLRDLRDSQARLVGEETIGNQPCWKLDVAPTRPDSVYSRFEMWVRKDNALVVKWLMYDKAKVLLKTFTAHEIRRVGGHWFISRSHMINHQESHTTDLILEKMAPRGDIPDDEFTVRNLEKL